MNYCYVTLLFSHNDKCDYFEGVILTGLGLRKQKVKYPLICLVTPDVPHHIRDIILKIWDKIIEVEYISPQPILKGILIHNILDPKYIEKNNSYLKMFTKMHIFNSEILPFDKILFVDSDLIPLKEFDNIFDKYNTPAGWLEVLYKNKNGSYSIIWGSHPFKDNQLIPIDYINVEEKPLNINAGLLLIKPDNNIYNEILSELKKDNNFKYMNLDGKIKNYYWCEQSYLTNKFLGKWYYINQYYNSWVFDKNKSKSIHMAGFYYLINNKKYYTKSWQVQNINDNYIDLLSNKIILWGLKEYPFLKEYIFNKLKILIYDEFIEFKNIDTFYFNLLSKDLQKIYKIKYK